MDKNHNLPQSLMLTALNVHNSSQKVQKNMYVLEKKS